MKVVINKQHGGFGLSQKAVEWLRENDYEAGEKCLLPGESYDGSNRVAQSIFVPAKDKEFRISEGVISVVEELEEEAEDDLASLEVVEIPDDVKWEIKEDMGVEWVSEKSRSWG